MKLTGLICAALVLAGAAMAQPVANPQPLGSPQPVANPQQGGQVISKTSISLGTATPGGGFPLYGAAFAEAMNQADPTMSIEPRNTKGSNENIPLLEKGELDLALVAGEPAYEAFMGLGGRPRTN